MDHMTSPIGDACSQYILRGWQLYWPSPQDMPQHRAGDALREVALTFSIPQACMKCSELHRWNIHLPSPWLRDCCGTYWLAAVRTETHLCTSGYLKPGDLAPPRS